MSVLLIGATTVFGELRDSMVRIWRAPPLPPGGGLVHLLKTRLLSVGLVLGIGFLPMVSLVVSAARAALGTWWAPRFGDVALLAHVLDWIVSFARIASVFAMIYKWVLRVRLAWRDVWIGATLTALPFIVGKSLIGLYIGSSSVASPFGAAAPLVVFLLWVNFSAQIFMLGAERTWVYAQRYGSLRSQSQRQAPAAPSRLPAVRYWVP